MMHRVQREFHELGPTADRTSFEAKLVRMAQSLEFEIAGAAIAVDRPGQDPIFEMIGNAPEEWTSIARDPKFVRRDPVLRRLRESSVPFIYDQTLYVESGAGDLWEMQAPFGFKTGIAMAMHLPGGRHFLLGLDRPQPLPKRAAQRDRMVADVCMLAVNAQEMAFSVMLRESVENEPAPYLSQQEIAILQWAAAGKSTWAIGQLMNLGQYVVRRRLDHVRATLGVATRQQAVARAVSLGLITP